MNMLTIRNAFVQNSKNHGIPKTSRGRALYTVDWFLNGKPVLHNHDNPAQTIQNGRYC